MKKGHYFFTSSAHHVSSLATQLYSHQCFGLYEYIMTGVGALAIPKEDSLHYHSSLSSLHVLIARSYCTFLPSSTKAFTVILSTYYHNAAVTLRCCGAVGSCAGRWCCRDPEQTDLILEAKHLDAFNANFKDWDDCRFPRVLHRVEDVLVRQK